ncbi:hypothetical protein Taro_040628, partial [Colocasia esculenta]|nr:hypothetical protein [Colocasia esculenta]
MGLGLRCRSSSQYVVNMRCRGGSQRAVRGDDERHVAVKENERGRGGALVLLRCAQSKTDEQGRGARRDGVLVKDNLQTETTASKRRRAAEHGGESGASKSTAWGTQGGTWRRRRTAQEADAERTRARWGGEQQAKHRGDCGRLSAGGAQIRLQIDDLNRESSVGVRRERRGCGPHAGEQGRRHTSKQGRPRPRVTADDAAEMAGICLALIP